MAIKTTEIRAVGAKVDNRPEREVPFEFTVALLLMIAESCLRNWSNWTKGQINSNQKPNKAFW